MNKQTGFTLIEVMVTVVIIGIALAVGVPSFRAYTADSSLTTFTNNFVAAVSLARSEAIRSGTNVSVIAGNADWSAAGWNIAIDADGDNVADAAEVLRAYTDMVDTTITMTDANNEQVVTFDRKGIMVEPDVEFVLSICDDRTAETGRQISLNVVGRVDLNPNFICP